MRAHGRVRLAAQTAVDPPWGWGYTRRRMASDAADTPSGAPTKSLDDKLEALPARPGVYLLKDEHGKVIYVGKARSLRSRVRTYFRGGDERSQVRFLMQRVGDFESLVTAPRRKR